MNYGLLFDPADLPTRYGDYVRDLVFRLVPFESAQSELVVRVGDLLHHRIPAHLITFPEIVSRLSVSNRLPGFMKLPLDEVLGSNRTYAFVLEGLGVTEARFVHSELLAQPAYRGSFGVDPSIRLHQWLFDLELISRYRISGGECWTSVEDEVDELVELGCFGAVGYRPGV